MQQDDPLRHTIAELTSRIQDEVSRRVHQLTLEVEAAETRGRQDGLEVGRREALVAAASIEREGGTQLLAALDTIESAASLGATLDALVDTASQRAGRACLFVVRGQRLESWRFAGFSPRPDLDAPLRIPLDSGGVLSRALQSRARVQVPDDSAPPDFASLPEGRSGLALPLLLAGRAVAVLYADDLSDVDDTKPVDGGGQPAATEESGTAAATRAATAVPAAAVAAAGIPSWHLPVVLLARYAAACLAMKTALGAARFVADRAGWFDGHDGRTIAGRRDDDRAAAGQPHADLQREDIQRDEEAQQAAHRYARLLVSEIKLYHEDAIAAGRRDRNLLERLGGEIARAQALYDERVPAAVRETTTFFRDELVRTLAGGDATLLRWDDKGPQARE